MKTERPNISFSWIPLLVSVLVQTPVISFLAYFSLGLKEHSMMYFQESPYELFFGRLVLCVLCSWPICLIVYYLYCKLIGKGNYGKMYVSCFIIALLESILVLTSKVLHLGYV